MENILIMKPRRAFSLVEMLIAVSLAGIVASIAVVTIANVVSSTKQQKLASDVKAVNRSISAFVASGGDLSDEKTADEVLVALKRHVQHAGRLPGLGGSKLDSRVTLRMQSPNEARTDAWRAYWNAATRRFELARSGDGPGIEAFELDPDLGEKDYAADESSSRFLYAAEDEWIWDYTEASPTNPEGTTPVSLAPEPSEPSAPETPISSPSPPGGSQPLQPPQFSKLSGDYPILDFDLPLTLTNPNPAGSSRLYYSVDYGNWRRYDGAISVPPDANVAAQAIASSATYTNSPRVDHRYAATPLPLEPPDILPDRPEMGLFSGREVSVTLESPNDPAVSTLQYRIAGDPWQDYSGPFSVSRDDYPKGALIRARAIPSHPHYSTSTATLRTLGIERLSVTGEAEGSFSDPVGGQGMTSNLAAGGTSEYFEWGDDSLDGHSRSWLSYESTSFNSIAGGDRFQVGSLSYYNGSIVSGSGADAVSFAIDLNFDVNGSRAATAFDFDFDLINTPNARNDPWDAADFVRIAQPVANQTIAINGIEFEFQLEFGETTADGVSLFDEFHVLEERSATTQLYGTLLELGSLDFNR